MAANRKKIESQGSTFSMWSAAVAFGCLPCYVGVANVVNTLEYGFVVKAALLLSFLFIVCSALAIALKTKAAANATVIKMQYLVMAISIAALIRPFFQGDPFNPGSVTSVVLLGVGPLVILEITKRTRRPIQYGGMSPLFLGSAIAATLAVGLSFTWLSGIYSSEKYRNMATGDGTIREAPRVCLPMFPGVNSGGLMCGILFAGAAVGCLMCIRARRFVSAMLYASFTPVFALGIYRTDNRTAAGVAVLAVFLTVIIAVLPRKMASRLDVAILLLPLFSGLLYPRLFNSLSGAASILPQQLVRGGEDVFSFNGRAYIWQVFGSGLEGPVDWIFGLGANGEVTAGLWQDFGIAVNGFIPVNPTLTHFHNIWFNTIYRVGLLGLVATIALLAQVLSSRRKSAIVNDLRIIDSVHLTLLRALLLAGTMDSMLSVSYEHFYPMVMGLAALLTQALPEEPATGTLIRPSGLSVRNRGNFQSVH